MGARRKIFWVLALLGAAIANLASSTQGNAAKPKLEFSFELERNDKHISRNRVQIPFGEASEFHANRMDGGNLFVEVLPLKRRDDSVLLKFAVGEKIDGRKILYSNPTMIVLNDKTAMLSVRETVGSKLRLVTKIRY